MSTVSDKYYLEALNGLAALIHDRNVRLGFYGGLERPFDGMMMNVVTEAAEAQEEWRNGRGFNEYYWTIKDPDDMYGDDDRPLFKMDDGKLWIRNYEYDFSGGAQPDSVPPWLEMTPERLRNMPNLIGRLKPEGIPSELADILIRVLDVAAYHQMDIARAVADKMAYNETRPMRHGGKRS